MELDQGLIGLTGKEVVFEVEKRHIRQFATAISDPNPLYTDEAFARDSMYGGIIAPPTFAIAIGQEAAGIELELDESRMLHGEQEFIYYRPIRLGETLYSQMKVADVYERNGKKGPMQFLVLDTEIRDESGAMVVISRMNIIYRSLSSTQGVK